MDSLRLTLVTPLKKVLESVEVSEIRIPADKGELTIFPDHSPLVTTLHTGVLTYVKKGSTEPLKAVITWGYCEIINGEVNLLAETAETLDKIDVELSKKNKVIVSGDHDYYQLIEKNCIIYSPNSKTFVDTEKVVEKSFSDLLSHSGK